METRTLKILMKKMRKNSRQIILSFLSYQSLDKKPTDMVFFKDFISYLETNALCMTPQIISTTKSDTDLFFELASSNIKISLDRENYYVEKLKSCEEQDEEAEDDDYEPFDCLKNVTLLLFAFIDERYERTDVDDILTEFITTGADINIKHKQGFTALIKATINDLPHYVEQLIELKANINLKDSSGKTALTYAINSGHEKIARMLLDHGAFVQYRHLSPSSSLLTNLLKELSLLSYQSIDQLIVEQIDNATRIMPLDVIKIISSYDSRASKHGYFKIIKNKDEEKYVAQEFKKTCTIM